MTLSMKISFLACAVCASLLLACQPVDNKNSNSTDNVQSAKTTPAPASQTSGLIVNTKQTQLDWQDCAPYQDWFDADIPKTLQCATLDVPLDNDKPEGRSIRLALTKLPATGKEVIGDLLVISGGPGDHSIDVVTKSLGDNSATLATMQDFNIIGFAPRGVEPSSPALNCGENTGDKSSQDLVDDCVKYSGKDYLKNISTNNAVLDIERIRLALGDKPISLIGYSYGTKVLARYLELFPNGVRSAVLDGVVDVTEDYFTALAGQYKGFQNSFERFAQYCTEYEACPFEDSKNYQEGFWQFLRDIDARELTDSGGRVITGDDVLSLVQDNLMWQSSWENIILLMQELQANNTETYNELTYDGSDPSDPLEEDLGLLAITCSDSAPSDKKSYLMQSKQVDALSVYDNYIERDDDYYLDPCYYWPDVGSDSIAKPVVSPNLPQVLFVAQKYDPTTPYANAVNMARFFNAPLLTRNGDGHTLVLTGESKCIDNKVYAYLKAPNEIIQSQSCD